MRAAAAVCAAIVLSAATARAARVIGDEVTKLEPVSIHRRHLLRRTRGLYGDRRHTESFEVPLFADGKNWTISLSPIGAMLAPNAVRGDGKPLDRTGYYQGYVDGLRDASFAHVNVDEDGAMMGFFKAGDETYFVRPAHAVDGAPKSVSPSDHVVYKQSDVVHDAHPKMAGCANHGDFDTSMTDDQIRARKRRALVQSGPYVTGQKVCEFAIYMDSPYVTRYGASTGLNLAFEMLATANTIFSRTAFTQGTGFQMALVWVDWSTSGSAASTTIDNLLAAATSGSAQRYLEQFSKANWGTYCLAHLLTYTDFSGTLGLAWTAYPDSENHNGGICQARYGVGSNAISLNTAWTTSLNFNQPQPLLQTSLVMTHELGHNWGSGHDPDLGGNIPADGVYIMYAYANQGSQPNNDDFSSQSIAAISAAVADRAACMVVSANPVCGNGLIESNATGPTDLTGYEEMCDAGVNTADECCRPNLSGNECLDSTPGGQALKAGKSCSPRSPIFGSCCTSSCGWEPTGTVCGVESECVNSGVCTERAPGELHNGTLYCPAGTHKNDTLSCEVGLVLGSGGRGSSLCDRGSCNVSVCSLFTVSSAALTTCNSAFGENACQVQCNVSGTCTAIGDITPDSDPWYLVTSGTANQPTNVTLDATARSSLRKPAGAACAFRQGEPTSGLCDGDGKCVEADGESDSLEELKKQYSEFKRAFTDWAMEENGGLPNYGWLIIGGILLLGACFTGCYYANRPQIQEMRRRSMSQRKTRPANNGASQPWGM